MTSDAFDFKSEARQAAVNEACLDVDTAAVCSIDDLCVFCQALANAIEIRLQRAFMAGRMAQIAAESREESGSE